MRLVAEVGVNETARRLEVPVGTVASWAHRGHVVSPDAAVMAKATAAKQVAWAERRIALGERLGQIAAMAAEKVAERVEAGTTAGVRDLAGAMALFVDKAQLLTGSATARAEVSSPAVAAEAKAKTADVLDELAAKRVA